MLPERADRQTGLRFGCIRNSGEGMPMRGTHQKVLLVIIINLRGLHTYMFLGDYDRTPIFFFCSLQLAFRCPLQPLHIGTQHIAAYSYKRTGHPPYSRGTLGACFLMIGVFCPMGDRRCKRR